MRPENLSQNWLKESYLKFLLHQHLSSTSVENFNFTMIANIVEDPTIKGNSQLLEENKCNSCGGKNILKQNVGKSQRLGTNLIDLKIVTSVVILRKR